MNGFQEISPLQLQENPFDLIGKQWALLTAADDTGANTMTISWGGVGVLWGKQVVFAFVRPQRHTLPFMEHANRFTLSFFDETYREKLSYCGTVSGRDEDKIAQCGFTVHQENGAVCFQEARLALVCRKLYVQDLREECFTDPKVALQNYPEKDYHRMFIGEIEKVFKAADKR